jgi:hypothetical protein
MLFNAHSQTASRKIYGNHFHIDCESQTQILLRFVATIANDHKTWMN